MIGLHGCPCVKRAVMLRCWVGDREAVDGPPSRSSLPDGHLVKRFLPRQHHEDSRLLLVMTPPRVCYSGYQPENSFLSINQGTVTAAANEMAEK